MEEILSTIAFQFIPNTERSFSFPTVKGLDISVPWKLRENRETCGTGRELLTS